MSLLIASQTHLTLYYYCLVQYRFEFIYGINRRLGMIRVYLIELVLLWIPISEYDIFDLLAEAFYAMQLIYHCLC